MAWLKTLQNEPSKGEAEAASAAAAAAAAADDDDEGEGEAWDQNEHGPTGDFDDEGEEQRKKKKAEEAEQEELAKFAQVLPRWQTKLFCVECVRRLLALLPPDSAHFSLAQAQQAPRGTTELLVLALRELVAIAFASATSPTQSLRPAGILALVRIVERFGAADDPDYEGKLLLELYHAQFRTALSECFGPEAEPSLTLTPALTLTLTLAEPSLTLTLTLTPTLTPTLTLTLTLTLTRRSPRSPRPVAASPRSMCSPSDPPLARTRSTRWRCASC